MTAVVLPEHMPMAVGRLYVDDESGGQTHIWENSRFGVTCVISRAHRDAVTTIVWRCYALPDREYGSWQDLRTALLAERVDMSPEAVEAAIARFVVMNGG